jgi:hypothetical protein
MNFGELATYIHDLRQSGFNTVPLRVQLNHKLAYPLITLVMADARHPLRAFHGQARLSLQHRRRHRGCDYLLRCLRIL